MDAEGSGFTVRDRRSFGEDGDLKEEQTSREKTDSAQKTEKKGNAQESPPLPEVNFNSLIFSLSSSALLNTGEIADPQTGEKKKDLPLAKHSIDIIAMLQEKTRGNLNDDEKQFIDSILTDLRLRYVRSCKSC